MLSFWHYGWVILVVSSIATVASAPGHSFGFNMFVNDMVRELDISRSLAGCCFTIGMIVSSILLPLAGRLVDQWGIRAVLCLSAVPHLAALAWLGYLSQPWELAMALVMMRFFGTDVLVFLAVTCVNKWFDKYRGRATSVFAVANMLLLAFPAIVVSMRANTICSSRRCAYLALDAVTLPLLLVCTLCMRDSPSTMGTLPDFEHLESDERAHGLHQKVLSSIESTTATNAAGGALDASLTVRDVLRSRLFWTLTGSMMASDFTWVGTTVHIRDIFNLVPTSATLGVDNMVNAFYLSLAPSALVTGLAMNAFILDNVPQHHWLMAGVCLMGAVVPGALYTGSCGSLLALKFLGATFGAFNGGFDAVINVMFAHFYGTRNFGAIFAIARSFDLFAGATSATVFGINKDFSGNYSLVLQIGFAWLLVCCVSLLCMVSPARKSSSWRSASS